MKTWLRMIFKPQVVIGMVVELLVALRDGKLTAEEKDALIDKAAELVKKLGRAV